MESLIRRRLADNENLCALLVDFGGDTAIFYQKAPADTDSPETLYPQIIFTTDKYADATRGTAGILNVDIITSQLTTPPEEIERLVRDTLEGIFFRPQAGEIFSLTYSPSPQANERRLSSVQLWCLKFTSGRARRPANLTRC